MQRQMLKSKIHRATVTACDLHYAGSITIDAALMSEADLLPHELVHVLDVDNGERFETYVIEGAHGSGDVQVNGAAARLVTPIPGAVRVLDDQPQRGGQGHAVDAVGGQAGLGGWMAPIVADVPMQTDLSQRDREIRAECIHRQHCPYWKGSKDRTLEVDRVEPYSEPPRIAVNRR